GSHGSERNSSNFYASWTAGLENVTPYNLPADVWDRLKQADNLFYRLHVANDVNWSNHDVTVADSQADTAPSIQIMSGTTGSEKTITFPSGSTFRVVDTPQDGIDYSDPVGNGTVPLIEVRDRMQENISKNFKVKELAATDGARYARISPELVAGLQRIRDRVGSAVVLNSGYRHNVLNETVGGADESQHITGRAADIRASAKSPLDLARIALEELGCDIGIGLGRNSIHVDLRGQLTSWRYEGAELSENEFDQWVRDTCQQLGRRHSERAEYSERVLPKIIGPEVYVATDEAPAFYIEIGPNSYYAVEIATHTDLFSSQYEAERNPGNFYSSLEREGLIEAHGAATTYTLPKEVWERLRGEKRLYYRIATSAMPGSNMLYSTTDQQAANAPWIEITGGRQEREEFAVSPLDLQATRKADENLWRK
ncbi:D-Ala-D-Ala carboxypeptidase family metallohydrolase, partial [Methanosarcina mazei]